MFGQRYSSSEYDQWLAAAAAARDNGAASKGSASMPGRTGKSNGQAASATPAADTCLRAEGAQSDNWACECLFECYNN